MTDEPVYISGLAPEPFAVRPVSLFREEVVRALLAILFVALLATTIIWALATTGGAHWANTKELLDLALPAETALLGSATGFYFGTKVPS